MLATTPLTAEGGAFFLLRPVLFVGYALVAVAAGLPLLALGATVPLDGPDEPPRPHHGGHVAE
jgi:hypothetical protein